MKKPTAAAIEIANRTEDAYSANRFNSWAACAQTCLSWGFNAEQTEAILRSKYMRWAADGSSAPYGKVPAKALADFRAECPTYFEAKAIKGLVDGTL